ncbi:MAG: hypothetical protein B5M48_03940 [Candidatus Omnitrophica bacterium 4484_213]|nr:MAG: hypothetical protein B5M48_03940 [Candidatus Omnitrophica bacterium 4484_213]
MDIKSREKIAIEAAKQTGKLLKENFGKSLNIQGKEDRSLVTNIDLKAEKAIIQLIKENYPEDGILSEESQEQFSNSDYKWIIDPLDGTHNYIHKIDIFGVSIALAFKQEVILGVIYIPLSDELYLAQKNGGAYLNQEEINVSKRTLSETTLIFDSSIRYQKKSMLACLDRVTNEVFNIRMFGSTARSLTYIAEGRADLEIEYNDKVWDFAAGLLLIEEAGGKVSDLKGKKWSLNSQGYVASNGIMHEEVLKIISFISDTIRIS